MGVLSKIRKAVTPQTQPSWHEPYPGGLVLYETDACNFEVLDNGNWYKIDANHATPELYIEAGVPYDVAERADSAIAEFVQSELYKENGGGYFSPFLCADCDPTPYYKDVLQEEFDGVRFVNMTHRPGVIY